VKDGDFFWRPMKLICLYVLFCLFSGTIHRTFQILHICYFFLSLCKILILIFPDTKFYNNPVAICFKF
jgi:hypothetical protein